MIPVNRRVHILDSVLNHKVKILREVLKSRGENLLNEKLHIIQFLKLHVDETIEIILHSKSSWKVFCDAYSSIQIAPVVVINKNIEDSLKPAVIISYDSDITQLQNKLSFINQSNEIKESSHYFFFDGIPLSLPVNYSMCIFMKNSHSYKKNNIIKKIAGFGAKHLYFSAVSQEYIKDKFPIQAWKFIFASNLPDIKFISDSCNIKALRLNNKQETETLFVFPERMLPLGRAYYVRAFDLLTSLFAQNIGVSVLFFGPGNTDLEKIKKILSIFCVNVNAHPLIRGNFTGTHRFVRRLEKFGRKSLNIVSPPPMRFNERSMIFATKTNSSRLKVILEVESTIKNVIFTGAWFYPAVKKLRDEFTQVKFYCDAHDVFFVVDEYSNVNEKRFFYSPSRQKKREIEALNSIDGVIAISPSDADSYTSAGITVPVLKESGSFEQASFGVDITHGPDEVVFGFIGSGNNNNRNCLKIILEQWWPSLMNEIPSATLVIAGSACKTPESLQLVEKYKNSVNLLGFVDDLSGFYNLVQVMLSPIIVRGGLNFKSAEALVAGRVLITTELGAECLADVKEGILVLADEMNNIKDVANYIAESGSPTHRGNINKTAEKVFGQDTAYQKLIEELS